MLRKIGECADLLLDERVLKFLEAGYSVLYHVVRLYEDLPGDQERRIARLVQLFEMQGSLSREFLIEQLRLVSQEDTPDANGALDPRVKSGVDQDFDLVLATLRHRSDRRRLADDYPDRYPLCLRTNERVATRAIAVILAHVADLPVIENKLLPGCGFQGLSRLWLLRDPLDAEVTHADIVVLAERGPPGDAARAKFDWLPSYEPVDAAALARRLVPTAKNRLHLFASEQCDGWTSVVGEANWSTSDE